MNLLFSVRFTMSTALCGSVLCVFVLFSTSHSFKVDQLKVKPGENVTLQCQASTEASIKLLKWIRPDLDTHGFVFFYRDNHQYKEHQHPSFYSRVKLREPNLKDGDVSVVLENINIYDSGLYQCYVAYGGKPELIRTVNLTVEPDVDEVQVNPGDDVSLHCQAPRDAAITLLEWRSCMQTVLSSTMMETHRTRTRICFIEVEWS